MGTWSTWRRTVEASKHEALEAVAHYNRPLADRGLEGFFMHMHTAWLYLLQAEFRRAETDIRYKKDDGRIEKVDGEPKCWDLARCARERWANAGDPVRANVDLTVRIRNKVEHRWTEALSLMVAGRAQSLVTNYHDELTTQFGESHTLATSLRFPVFVGVLSREGAQRLAAEQARVGKQVRRLICDFEAGLDATTLEDPRYEMRVHLVERTGPKSEADMAIDFIRAADLTAETRQELRQLGRDGAVVIRDVIRPVVRPTWVKPKVAVEAVDSRVPFIFHMSHFISAWKRLKVRPPNDATNPRATKAEYCAYDEPHGDYVYSPEYIAKLVDDLGTEERWRGLFGKAPVRKISIIRTAS